MPRKFFKNTLTIVVLSEDESVEGAELGTIAYEIVNGDWSGVDLTIVAEEVDGPTMAKLLQDQGSDPEFFSLDEDGNEIEN